MSEFLSNILNVILGFLGVGGVFVVCIGAIFLAFIITFFLTLLKTDFGAKQRAWFYIFSAGILAVECGLLISLNSISLFFISLGISAFLAIPIISIRVKKAKITEGHLKLARFIDKQAKNADKYPKPVERIKCDKPLVQEESLERFELDFQHVKNVVARLEYYPLSASDKKIVSELECAILQAENGDSSQLVKTKINDGLGALLKIMSKYGV